MKKYIFLSLFIVCGQMCFGKDVGSIDPKAIPVSLIQLLTMPQKYDEKKVRVFGVCFLDREGSYLFLTLEHCEAYDTESAIELPSGQKLLPASLAELAKFQKRFVAVEGVFKATGGFEGRPTLSPVTRILLRDR